MKLALLTYYVPTPQEDYQQLADLIIPARDAYCARHGYQHVAIKGPYGNPLQYYAFQRLALLRDLLDRPSAADIYWVLNLQSVITNHAKPVDFLDDEHDCWLTKDVHGINMGSFFVRNTAWTRQWLDFIIAQEPTYRHQPWREQKAVMDWWLHEKWTWMIHLLPHRAANSYLYRPLYDPWPAHTPGQWKPGDLVLSLPGLNLQQRLDMVRSPEMEARIIR